VSAGQRAGGVARQAQIRAVLGENGFRRYQQALGRAGGIARQAQLRAALGEPGYAGYQRALYQRAVQKHGAVKMRAILTVAHERRRHWRIANPTPAEAILHWEALQAGLTLHADLTGSFTWSARVLGYACDLLLPARALAIEVLGGVHALTVARDAARQDELRAQGLTVVTLTNDEVYTGAAAVLFASLLEARHAT
jgi:very-short-patch-repair endonuclease